MGGMLAGHVCFCAWFAMRSCLPFCCRCSTASERQTLYSAAAERQERYNKLAEQQDI